MKRRLLFGVAVLVFLLSGVVLFSLPVYSASIKIDHTCTDISKIPKNWINTAKSNLRCYYGHTSHGSQLITGMSAYQDDPAYGEQYGFTREGEIRGGFLSIMDSYDIDLGNPDYTTWESRTREYLNGEGSNRNVILWSWCGQLSGMSTSEVDQYLNLMAGLESDYPGVKFVYFTGHLDGSGTGGTLNQNNIRIRSWCTSNNRILFDFADIESYNPSGNGFLSQNADDGCNYSGGNWAQEWIAAHPTHEFSRLASVCEECAHSETLNCILKGGAAWWLMARIAGWDGTTTTTNSITITSPNTGVEWEVGSSHSIKWNYTGTIANVKIEYSINNGSSWSTIILSTSNTGSYLWTIPNTPSTHCLVRVSNTTGSPSDTSDYPFTIKAQEDPPTISLSPTSLYFAYSIGGSTPGAQTFLVSNSGGGTLSWTLTEDASWLNVSPSSGTNSGLVTVTVDPTGLAAGTYNKSIQVSDSNATNSPQTVAVTFTVKEEGQDDPPFGSFDTPADNSNVCSSIPVTGWALDDIDVANVQLFYYNEGERVYIGDAVFVEGARPDVQSAFPAYPNNSKAGWGYMLLTNFLPNGGNGTFILEAVVTDSNGQEVSLGTKTIICDNEHAVKPFGAIDTPTQGGTASGREYVVFGWALTPQPNIIPIDGSTISVWVDGVQVGNPEYNVYREDIANLFPGYNNADGASGYFYFNTTGYQDGVHTISWQVQDSGANADGIGSRYFTILNSETSSAPALSHLPLNIYARKGVCAPEDKISPVLVKKGFTSIDKPETVMPCENGSTPIEIKPLELVKVSFRDMDDRVGSVVNLSSLPIGSTLDTVNGEFSWQPGPGFYGVHRLEFLLIHANGQQYKKTIDITIR